MEQYEFSEVVLINNESVRFSKIWTPFSNGWLPEKTSLHEFISSVGFYLHNDHKHVATTVKLRMQNMLKNQNLRFLLAYLMFQSSLIDRQSLIVSVVSGIFFYFLASVPTMTNSEKSDSVTSCISSAGKQYRTWSVAVFTVMFNIPSVSIIPKHSVNSNFSVFDLM